MSRQLYYICIVILFSSNLCSGRKSAEKCKYYQEINKKYDTSIQDIIIGGTDCSDGDYPHMAALGYGQRNNINWQCGGTLISEQHILTAAHCKFHPQLGEVKFAKLGDTLLIGTEGIFDVSKINIHPGYKSPSKYHDIAILELNVPVNFSTNIRPACLYQYENFIKFAPIATGWGLTEFGGRRSTILQQVTLTYFTNEECYEEYKRTSKRILSKGIQPHLQICVGSRNKEKDTCQGDSGGPLIKFLREEGLHFIVGITSFGKTCGVINVPGVYTKVLYYIPWIESVVWPNLTGH